MIDRIFGLFERIIELPIAPIEKVRVKHGMLAEAICVVVVGVVYFLPVILVWTSLGLLVGIVQRIFEAIGCRNNDSR
jgi:hypothetical protein